MCLGTTSGEGYLIKKEILHETIEHLYTKDIAVDGCIGNEIEYLLRNGIATNGHSCCGHGREQAQVWIFPEYVERARDFGYKVATAFDMDGNKRPSVLLKQGTQSDVLRYEGYIHGDENGMIDGMLPPKPKFQPYLGWITQ